jgi:putative sterol carrier protein
VASKTTLGRKSSPTDEFFADLAGRGHEPLLKSATGTVRFDLPDDGHARSYYVTIRNGDVTVTQSHADADAVLRVERETFDGMATGQVNALAAVLRGELVADGDLGLLILFQRIFPSPSGKGGSHTA